MAADDAHHTGSEVSVNDEAVIKKKVLVVDDEEDLELLVRQKFRRRIRKGEFEFVFAHNGQEALERLAEHDDIRLVLTDINMPVMDGLALLSQLEDVNPDVRAVIVSAYGDMDNIRTAMNRGAFDFVTKPIDFNDLEITIEKTLKHVITLQNALQSRDRLVAIKRELEVAYQVQTSVLPTELPSCETHEIAARMIPAREIGGDFYDFFDFDDQRIGLVIADVSGKGIPAALFTMVTRALLKAAAKDSPSPAECLNMVNNVLSQDNESCVFVTLFYGVLDLRTGRFLYSNGGHNAPRLRRSDGSVEELEATGNLVLAVEHGHEYNEEEVQLAPGDGLFLYTDGISEAENELAEEFGEERLDAALASVEDPSPEGMVSSLVKAVRTFAGEAPQSDDLTCIAARLRALSSD